MKFPMMDIKLILSKLWYTLGLHWFTEKLLCEGFFAIIQCQ